MPDTADHGNPPAKRHDPQLEGAEQLEDHMLKSKDGFSNEGGPNSTIENASPATESLQFDGAQEEEALIPQSFERSNSPTTMQRNKSAGYERVGDSARHKMHRFSLYETTTRFYLVAGDVLDRHFRVLKIDRTAPPGHLNIFEDEIVYDKREMNQLLNAIDDGNKASGGLKLKCSSWGLMGFIRFTEAYYMLLITKRTQVAMLGGHYIYQVDGTELIPLTTGSTSKFQRDRNPEEARYLSILNNFDLNNNFYFSYSYNITRSLQQNIIREREALAQGQTPYPHDWNDMFVWNRHLLNPAVGVIQNTFDWCLPVIHGFIAQSSLNVFGRRVYLTIIARRSRCFAGARFLKRGSNDLGYVANDVETEQIVSEMITTSFHAPGPRLFANPTYTSYVQHRGSIPLYWTQENTGVTPKPDIDLNLVDPFYEAAALHFDNLFERYGSPIYAVNLIKARERTPRESKLLYEFESALRYLNQSLPEGNRILYKAFDMSRAVKTRGQDVIGTLDILSGEILAKTGFFHNGGENVGHPSLQNGVARTNCIDCLDRTNAAQSVIGKRAFGRQLQSLGIIEEPTVEYETDAADIFTNMFHEHGDTIAVQYGGSHLVNTMSTYRKINQWQSSSRDMVESFKRYYNNSFIDAQRQEAYNLFLGNYIYAQGQPMLWELASDYYLHHRDPRSWNDSRAQRRNYIQWYTPKFLERRSLPHSPEQVDDYWLEFYRPLAISSLAKVFSYRLIVNTRYISGTGAPSVGTGHQDSRQGLSPFRPRRRPDPERPTTPDKKTRKGVTIFDPLRDDVSIITRPGSAPREISPIRQGIIRESKPTRLNPYESAQPLPAPAFSIGSLPVASSHDAVPYSSITTGTSNSLSSSFPPGDKTLQHLWTLNQFHHHSLNPTVSAAEAEEYDQYVRHPLELPLVVGNELPGSEELAALIQSGEFGEDSSLVDFMVYVGGKDLKRDLASGSMLGRNALGINITDEEMDNGAARWQKERPWEPDEEVLEEYHDYLVLPDDPLTVRGDDGAKKRYKAYRQWLRGKSLFKQSKVDPEYRPDAP
ncbi:hypothetical protein P152DRAFT_508783 [Eremomyces bilateralis CBS 781.70]|uniref:SAC domain-containing protein n=1 Tax=Eremomyces bilateralis CBS 781.70 TaxID=1392243 RepID=A0A6G1FXJ7_9PEZI|nr:uncharacterized protein P152DRAFT_508783 [Eremomyces bilateralis CBS 781.70]KAF1810504.1 hypothetical protein P152DRAFT_508783 [Eremomyces bilateralis CBS 781.70]